MMKMPIVDIGKPKHLNYRVCYDSVNPNTRKKVYELYKYCICPDCNTRRERKREPNNCATANTEDISKVDGLAEFLKNWTCEDGKRYLETVRFKF
jgi:hypothetical protein